MVDHVKYFIRAALGTPFAVRFGLTHIVLLPFRSNYHKLLLLSSFREIALTVTSKTALMHELNRLIAVE